MPRKLFGVADLNIPGPDTNAIAAHVKTMSVGGKPITTEQIAKALSCSVGAAEYGLNMAKRMGLVRQVAKGWMAT